MAGYNIKNEGIYQNVNRYIVCSRRLKYCPYGTCGIREDKEFNGVTEVPIEILMSYSTEVAFYSPKTGHLIVRGSRWSSTTGKHISAFLRECGVKELTYGEINKKVKYTPFAINVYNRSIVSFKSTLEKDGKLIEVLTPHFCRRLVADDLDCWWDAGEIAIKTLFY